jgi:hypothetical protein
MSKLSDLPVEELIEVIRRARGCGCCADYDDIDDCPRDDDDDGWVDHTYNTGCVRDFSGLLTLLVDAARRN